jgi:tetratricopeptide (TPR) repeat protein
MFAGFSHARALEDITAVRDYYEALAKGGDPEKICPYLVKSLLALGKVSEAADMMANSYAKMPDSISLAKAYADVALRLGDGKLLRTLLEKVLQKEPYLQTQNMSLAKILWDAGDRDAAAQCLQRIATVYADDVPSRALLGEYYLGKSDPVSAIKPLEQASQYVAAKTSAKESLTTMLAAAYHLAADRAGEKAQYAEAADFYEKAIRMAPADLNAYAGQANAWVQLKQFRRAAETLEKLISLQPANPTIPLSLGDIYYQNGNAEQARHCWTKALQLTESGDAELRSALDARLAGRITAETFK